MSAEKSEFPQHIAIIMDGNRRWAKKRFLPAIAGHKKGVDAVKAAVNAADDLGVKYLTLYSFSTENWDREQDEVGALMKLLIYALKKEVAELNRKNCRLRVVGFRQHAAKEVAALFADAEQLTKNNTGLQLNIAFNYGGKQDILQATKKIAAKLAAGEIVEADINEQLMDDNLLTHDLPDPDLVIRTSGEVRVSNFLTWQTAYSEFIFLDIFWPEFNKKIMQAAIDEYAKRQRRFGG
ncbi:MAG: isoprenyl transferase [Rhizobiales bacterium]|nr:isoprenyl transferase [Hyphomicrobiales bacterium]NRB15722.1 isoprenyl transferase [Hyphomicrobiales bacterium]